MAKDKLISFYHTCKEFFYLMDDLEVHGYDKHKFLQLVMKYDKILDNNEMTPEEKTEYMRKNQAHKKYFT